MRLSRGLVLLILCSFAFTGCDAIKDLFEGDDDDVDAGPSGAGVGEPCAATPNCRTGLVCNGTICQPSRQGPSGSICQLSADCAEGLYCGPTRLCTAAGTGGAGDECSSTGDCQSGFVCQIAGFANACAPGGTVDLGDPCTGSAQCLAGLECMLPPRGTTTVCQSPPPRVPGGDGGITLPPTLPYWPGETCVEEMGTPTAYFEIPMEDGTPPHDFYRLPFPNDIRRTATGLNLRGHPSPGTVLPIDIMDRYLRAAEQDLDGFATNPVIYFRFSSPYRWESVGGDPSSIALVDITPGSPTYGDVSSLAWLTTFGPLGEYICPDWIAMRRPVGQPLRPGTTYAAYLTTGVTPSAGGTYARSTELDMLLGATAPSEPRLARAHAAYAPFRAWLADVGRSQATILNAAVFTTQSPEAMMPKLRQVIRALPEPAVSNLTVCDTGVTSPCDDGTPERSCGARSNDFVEIHGKISLPIFQAGTPPYETPEDGGGIAVDASGNPVVARTEQVCFALTVPRDVTPPSSGFPLVVFAHGTGGSFTAAARNGVAEAAARGDAASGSVQSATLTIDLPQHGSRRGSSTRDPDVLFFNFLNPRAARDNIAQGSADMFSLVHWASTYDAPAASSPSMRDIRFDLDRLVFFSHSQGSTHAALMLPFEPDISASILSGVGGDLTQSLMTKTEPVDIAAAVPIALLDAEFNPSTGRPQLRTGIYHPALAMFQMYFERVDPVNFGGRLFYNPLPSTTGRHVFMTYGPGDSYSTIQTMQAFANAAGFSIVRPVIEAFGLPEVSAPLRDNAVIGSTPRTFGLRQYMPAAGEDGHFVAFDTTQGRADTFRFMHEALAGMSPAIGAP